ncbi:FAD-dependent oxidoreductase [Nocardioides sp. LHD-245]|uniref:oxidoreductase n=1 Tax=Nocardioides sp. LHD-245 TaxID=3051387 RepID=UPI0027E126C0|nr:FAD-dependent oxidoreductase [Nocardioides sp. LHD-245]
MTEQHEGRYPHVFTPITIGTMRLRNRIMVPPHGSGIGNLWGTDAEAETHMAYWESRALDGASWIDGVRGRVRNPVIPGFDTGGYGAETIGNYRQPNYVERVQELAHRLHRAGVVVTSQLTVIGGVPQSPGRVLSSPLTNARPHVMSTADVAEYVEEYRFSATRAREAGLDGIELHLNHDDMLEWFLSPLTNDRTDRYGGSLENRARFAVESLRAVREAVGSELTVGVRFNLREEMPEGYDEGGGVEVAQLLEATGLVDYLHAVVGSPWGDPSYIQSQHYDAAQWAELAGRVRKEVSLPVVYAGRVNTVAVAEQVLAAGHADVVGIARAYLAERDLLAKARAGREDEIRPCVGGNDCISRQYAEGLPFSCAVNPHVKTEAQGRWGEGDLGVAASPRKLLVIGGGPAGLELAALAAESGHQVALWEAGERLGGQLATVANAPTFDKYGEYLTWQEARLARLGVDVRRATTATVESVVAAEAEVVAVATGARPHRPVLPGVDLPHVVDAADVLGGTATVGDRVLIIARDDHLPPLTVADLLAGQGRQVTLVYGAQQPGQQLGRYILGGVLARLHKQKVEFRHLEEVRAIHADGVDVRHVYTFESQRLSGYDTVVLACGADSDDTLFQQLQGKVPELHVLGDAYAPRRLSFATRQAYALAEVLAGHPEVVDGRWSPSPVERIG